MPSSYALGPRFEALMTELIQSGRYNSKSEILRDGWARKAGRGFRSKMCART